MLELLFNSPFKLSKVPIDEEIREESESSDMSIEMILKRQKEVKKIL